MPIRPQQRKSEEPGAKLEGFRQLPSHLLQQEPFLQFLYDKKYEEVVDVVEFQQQEQAEVPQPKGRATVVEVCPLWQ